MAERPVPPPPKVTITQVGRWKYRIELHSHFFLVSTWYRLGLERAKRKALLELRREVVLVNERNAFRPQITYSLEDLNNG